MGAIVSTADRQAQTQKWEGLVTELESLCRQQRQALDREFGGSDGGRRRRSSILKSDAEVRKIEDKRKSASAAGSEPGDLSRSRRNSSVSFTGGRPPEDLAAAIADAAKTAAEQGMKSPTGGASHFKAQTPAEDFVEVDGKLQPKAEQKRQNRQDMLRWKKIRKEFFETYMEDAVEEHSPIKCSYLGHVCAALSYLLSSKAGGNLARKNRVTVEDIFFTCHLPLHYIANSSITLAELYDICREFIEHDPRFRDQVRVEVVHMDPVLVEGEVEQGEMANETGDRGPLSLAAFRKTLEEDMQGLAAVRIYNFDPFIVEQSKVHVDDTDDDEDEEEDVEVKPVGDGNSADAPAIATPSHQLANDCLAVYKPQDVPKTKFGAKNRGWFSLCYDYNPAQHMLLLADSHIDTEVHLTKNEAPLTALYRACCSRDRFNRRCRGFIRFSMTSEPPLREEEELESRELFVPDLYLGKGPKGIPLSSVDPSISTHLSAYAFATHLIQGLVTDEAGVGVSVMDIVKTLSLPQQVIVGFPMSMLQAFAYFQAYLAKSKLSEKIFATAHPIEKKVDTDDAPPTMSIMDFESVLVQTMERSPDSTQPSVVMVLCFEVGCAHNMLSLAHTTDSHYGVLMSYDQDKQMATILDVSPKKYTRIWATSLLRLHKALVGRGYVMVYKRDEEEGLGEITVGRQDTMIRHKLKSLTLPPTVTRPAVSSFEFPSTVMCITALAVAVTKLGRPLMVREIFLNLDIDPSFLVSDHISVRDLARVGNNFLNISDLRQDYSLQVTNFDAKQDGTARVSLPEFGDMVQKAATDPNQAMIIQCAKALLTEHGAGSGGEYCVLVDYEHGTQTVLLSDVNPQIYFRHISIPLRQLYAGVCLRDSVSVRARGVIIVHKGKPMEDCYRSDKGRELHMLKAPAAHPFKVPTAVHLSAISFAFTAIGYPCSPESVFYSTFTCLAGERYRRGSAIFPWQQLKISLHDLKERLSVAAVAKMATKYAQTMQLDYRGETVVALARDQFSATVAEGVKKTGASSVVMVVYKVDGVQDMQIGEEEASWQMGCGLCKDFDEETGIVTVADCNPTRYGDFWTCHIDKLYKATELEDADQEEMGLVKLVRNVAGLGADIAGQAGGKAPATEPATMTFNVTGF